MVVAEYPDSIEALGPRHHHKIPLVIKDTQLSVYTICYPLSEIDSCIVILKIDRKLRYMSIAIWLCLWVVSTSPRLLLRYTLPAFTVDFFCRPHFKLLSDGFVTYIVLIAIPRQPSFRTGLVVRTICRL